MQILQFNLIILNGVWRASIFLNAFKLNHSQSCVINKNIRKHNQVHNFFGRCKIRLVNTKMCSFYISEWIACITNYIVTTCLNENSLITNICYIICYATLRWWLIMGMSERLNISQTRIPSLNGHSGDTNNHKTHLLLVVVRHVWPLEYHSVCEICKFFVHANCFGFVLISGVLFSKLNRKRKHAVIASLVSNGHHFW